MIFSSTGAIPKGRGIGTIQRPVAQPLPDIGAMQVAAQQGTPVKQPISLTAAQSPMRTYGRGMPHMPGTPQRAPSSASEMPSSIFGPPICAAPMSSVSTPLRAQVSTPTRPQMVGPATMPGTPVRAPSNLPTPTHSRYSLLFSLALFQHLMVFK